MEDRWRQLKDIRRKPGGIVAIAVARELAAYCWEIAICPTALEPTPTQPHARGLPTRARGTGRAAAIQRHVA
jgi:hypothetical protein